MMKTKRLTKSKREKKMTKEMPRKRAKRHRSTPKIGPIPAIAMLRKNESQILDLSFENRKLMDAFKLSNHHGNNIGNG